MKTDSLPKNTARPIGVWILTIYAIVFAGILPLWVANRMFDEATIVHGVSSYVFGFSTLLSIFIIIFGIGTWLGRRNSMIAFVVVVIIHLIFMALLNADLLSSGILASSQKPGLLVRTLRAVIWPAIYIWYFSRISTRRYFNN